MNLVYHSLFIYPFTIHSPCTMVCHKNGTAVQEQRLDDGAAYVSIHGRAKLANITPLVGGFHGHAGYPKMDVVFVSENPIVRNGWWLGVPLWLRNPPHLVKHLLNLFSCRWFSLRKSPSSERFWGTPNLGNLHIIDIARSPKSFFVATPIRAPTSLQEEILSSVLWRGSMAMAGFPQKCWMVFVRENPT